MAAANSQEPLESPIKESLEAEKSRLEQLRSYDRSYDELHQLLEELPKKTTHRITVPFGKVAFFPGKLVHTNEMLVHLGAGWHLERSAHEARDFVQRRRQGIAGQLSQAKARVDELSWRLSTLSPASSQGEGQYEIREEYVEGVSDSPSKGPKRPQRKAHHQSQPGKSEHDDLMAKLEAFRLAEEEEEQEGGREQEASSTANASEMRSEQSPGNEQGEPTTRFLSEQSSAFSGRVQERRFPMGQEGARGLAETSEGDRSPTRNQGERGKKPSKFRQELRG